VANQSLRVIDPGPLARLDEVQADEAVPTIVFQRLTEGESLQDIARKWQVPVGRFVQWFMTEHAELYDAALKVKADELVHGALTEADTAKDRDSAAAARVKADIRLKVASKWDRKRYGDADEGRAHAPVTIQIANLRGAPLSITTGEKPDVGAVEVYPAEGKLE